MTLVHPPATHRPRVLDLAGQGSRPAVRTAEESLTYADLAGRVDDTAALLGDLRRLVLVEGANRLDSLVAYLAALTHGHVVLLSGPGAPAGRLAEAWRPDVWVRDGVVRELRDGTGHTLHPDLALLLSTSGTTGSPKLVRLSRDNLRSNAASIAEYLRLTPDDRAITSLPLHYCYGLSVIHSHLLVGAGVILTDLSVVDECFWGLAESAGATSFAGVPYTFELLERSGVDPGRVPSLRQVTQAGGRLDPDRVREWSVRGRRAGWDLVVMYGATEATARMAWLPPALAATHPTSIGVPIPGGSFRIEPVPDAPPGCGELVYSGPNVMLGYAGSAPDLGRGRELAELRTGDLAREVDGMVEVVGRRGRQVKLFGLRVDLDHLERLVAGQVGDVELRCVVADGTLHAFHTRPRVCERLGTALVAASGLPRSAVRVTRLDALPRTASGKPDLDALADHARLLDEPAAVAAATTLEGVCREYAVVLARADVDPADSFTGLGGDSLSYVELSVRLSRRLELPRDWPSRPIRDLVAAADRRRGVRLDTSVVLRALAIVAIVGTHANLFTVVGGAHLLLVVAGFNFARFQLSTDTRARRLRHGVASLAQLAVPAALWVGGVALVTGFYSPATALLLNGLVGSDTWTVQWQFWFLEALVWLTASSLALVAVPMVDRLERRRPWRLALGLVLAALAVRFASVGLQAGATERYTVGVVALWFALGWAACRADTAARRWSVVGLAVVGTVGFFGDPLREGLIVAGVALLVLVPAVRVPAWLVGPLSLAASASLFVYLTHWQVYPHLENVFPLGATVASFAVGISVWWLSRPALRRLGRALQG